MLDRDCSALPPPILTPWPQVTWPAQEVDTIASIVDKIASIVVIVPRTKCNLADVCKLCTWHLCSPTSIYLNCIRILPLVHLNEDVRQQKSSDMLNFGLTKFQGLLSPFRAMGKVVCRQNNI